jgi:hypothetical protein
LGGRDEVNSDSDVVKNSLVGSTKKNVKDTLSGSEAKTLMPKKVKEMEVTPQNSKGVKKMDMPGKEKRIKLKESKADDKITKYEGYTYTLNGKEVKPEIAFYNNILKAELDGEIYRISEPINGKIELAPIKGKTGMYTEAEQKLRSVISKLIREELK